MEKFDIQKLFDTESEYMAAEGYFLDQTASSQRNVAIPIIRQCSRDYDPITSLLAVTYYDRYVSRHPLEDQTEEFLQLFATCCVVLAYKMTAEEPLDLNQFLVKHNLNHMDVGKINRTELQILFRLHGQMQSITAFRFLDYFINWLRISHPNPDHDTITQTKIKQNLLYRMHFSLTFTRFRPSIMAASAIVANYTSAPEYANVLQRAFASHPSVHGETLGECIKQIRNELAPGEEDEPEDNDDEDDDKEEEEDEKDEDEKAEEDNDEYEKAEAEDDDQEEEEAVEEEEEEKEEEAEDEDEKAEAEEEEEEEGEDNDEEEEEEEEEKEQKIRTMENIYRRARRRSPPPPPPLHHPTTGCLSLPVPPPPRSPPCAAISAAGRPSLSQNVSTSKKRKGGDDAK